MYFSSNTGGAFHIWRQRFPEGRPEQITSGPTEEEGIAMVPDGRSLVTSVGLRQRTLWVQAGSERQITSEGYAGSPALSADGKKLYYLMRREASQETPLSPLVSGDLWMADLDSGRKERLLPGLLISFYDVSPDGKRVAFAAADADGKSRLWLASLERRFAPRKLGEFEAGSLERLA